MQEQDYITNATLFIHQLIQLSKYKISPIPQELQRNKNITVKVKKGDDIVIDIQECHIDDTDDRRLRLPLDVMIWLKSEFPFSVAYFMNKDAESIWKKRDIKKFFETIKSEQKLNMPAETLKLSWIPEEKPYLCLQAGFKITTENASKVLSSEAMSKVLPYIFSSVQNTSYVKPKSSGKKCFIIDSSTKWLSASQYSGLVFSHPGIYLLRRKQDEKYVYYVGKSVDIMNRITRKGNKLFHPEEKGEDNKQYDDICCISINMDDIINLYGTLDDSTRTPNGNPGVSRGSKVDNSLYAVEDIAIHTISMILLSEGKHLDNRQYRTYTSESLLGEVKR